MLWTLVAVMLILWLLGFSLSIGGGLVHILLVIALVLVVIEGALRKWVFPGLQNQIYLVKDGVLILAYVGFLGSASRNGQTPL